ncbi:MAG: DUF5591 domain-containing protein [Candidatus Hydrothermarchaeales archaeon]
MLLSTAESLNRPEVARWHDRILNRYTPPPGIKLSVLLPCSARKPYSKSKSHILFRKYIKRGAGSKLHLVHEVILTSPLGLVPRELENLYPAAHYDVPVTGHWSGEEKEIAINLLSSYMKKAEAPALAHVEGAYREICGSLSIPMTAGGLNKSTLEELQRKIYDALKDCQPVKVNRRLENLRRACDFQFGLGAGNILIPEETAIKGYQLFLKGEQIAAIKPGDGFLALASAGGRLLKDYGRYWVEISFKPDTNSIFSVGVDKADKRIRPNDEVVVLYNGDVVGVGKALLNGEEMTRAEKGLAVELRHRL